MKHVETITYIVMNDAWITEAELFMKGIYRKTSTYDAILSQLAGGTNEVSILRLSYS